MISPRNKVSSTLLKKLGKTLTGGALTWYSQLPTRSIETFKEMADKFVTAHIGAKKAEVRVNDIFAIKQSLGETEGLPRPFQSSKDDLAECIKRDGDCSFLERAEQKWFKGNEKTIKSANEVQADEDDLNGSTHGLTSVQAESRKDRRNDVKSDLIALRPNQERHLPYVRSAIVPPSCHEEGPPKPRTGTHRNEREIVYTLENLGPKVKWPQKMRSDSSTGKSHVLCEFHQERGHKTEDCIALRQEVVNTLRQGHLKELLSDRERTSFARGREQHQ
ncbi:PREDICTED: uncharacterized protein LOC109210682 [Nicotiana attenuata]|uniref:uncharacterized protein LOC109210682 n=1 Tax=Nicotiana attenuata TaxID=49451 RepID=UPI000905B355|nr:PREDICTED: uncharacterized protein LOC109210682 [Nicotiana attenuata]